MNNELENESRKIDLAFEHIKPMDYEKVFDGLKEENQSLQSKIDSLMIEFCPNDMTDDQIEKWCKHQMQEVIK